jgi:FkbM family methyltransferase
MASKQHWLLKVRPAFLASFIKRLLRVERKLVETTHGKFFVDPFSNFGDELISQVNYEPEMTKVISSILEQGDTFLDVGANEGYFSILGSHIVGETGKVISIEPQTRLLNIIFRNMLENQCFNIHVFQRAISDNKGIVNISLSPDMNTGSSGLLQLTKYKTKTQLVPQMTLRDFLGLLSIGKVKLMKIDVEGFEYEVILGSRKVFEDSIIENIALELHPGILKIRNKESSDILNFLESCGYKKNNLYSNLVMTKQF